MRSVEMIVEFPIEDANLPSPSVMHARRIVEVRASVVEKPDWAPPTPSAPTFECPNCGTTIFAAGDTEQEEAEK